MATAIQQDGVDAEPGAASIVSAAKQRFTCPQCGHVLRVSGRDRHRIYFELDDENLSDPVMDGLCPQCGRGLHDMTA
jgi:predicted RNA-binding Zn-ribbon protein involved in translation (DUF1610 family)